METDQIAAFRLRAHHLDRRLPAGSLAEAAGACAMQDSPPGSALLALYARVAGLTADGLAHALGSDKSLLRTWCMRGAPFLFPTADLPVFTAGVLPDGEAGRRHLIPGVELALAELYMSLAEAVERTERELAAVLSGRPLAIGELGARLSDRIVPGLSQEQAGVWLAEGPYAPGQPLGEGVVHFVIRILALKGLVCFTPRTGGKAPFVLTAEWLDRPPIRPPIRPPTRPPTRPPGLAPEAARAELTRRYLRCYGPSTPAGLAAWTGLAAEDATLRWRLVADELAEVDAGGRDAWLLACDLDALRAAEPVSGVRLLPPRDPYTQAPDRARLVPDQGLHQRIWRAVGEPGTVLADGRLVATWRQRRRGRRLEIDVEPFARLGPGDRERVEAEAANVAELRGATGCQVRFG